MSKSISLQFESSENISKGLNLEKCSFHNSLSIEEVEKQDEGEEEDKPRISNCFACHSPTEQPCWYCTICTGELIFDFDVARITQNLTF